MGSFTARRSQRALGASTELSPAEDATPDTGLQHTGQEWVLLSTLFPTLFAPQRELQPPRGAQRKQGKAAARQVDRNFFLLSRTATGSDPEVEVTLSLVPQSSLSRADTSRAPAQLQSSPFDYYTRYSIEKTSQCWCKDT